MHKTRYLFLLGLVALASCDSLSAPQIYPPTPKPDYTIKVVPTANGLAAIPPGCPSWSTATADPYDNQPLPQFGCANARNLAMMIEEPKDLVHGRDAGNSSSGVLTVGAMRRYYNNQTRGLIDTDTAADTSVAVTTSSTAASPMSGDNITGGGSSSSSSAAPAAP